MRYALALLSLLLLVGCSSKQPDQKAQTDKLLNFGMTQSKKIEILENATNAKTYVTITYLQPLKHDIVDKEKEQFVVGIYYMTGVSELSKTTLRNFTINSKANADIRVVPLSSDSTLLKLVSSSNPWSDYLLIETAKIDEIDMTIGFENGQSQRVSVAFRKDY